MTDWATFAVMTVALTLVLLLAARRSQLMLDRARLVDDEDARGDGPTKDGPAKDGPAKDGPAEDGPPRTFDHPDAVDRDFDDLDPPVANAADPFLDDERSISEDPNRSTTDTASRIDTAEEPPSRNGPTLSPELLLANVMVSQALALAVLVGIAWWTDVPSAAFGLAPSDIAAPLLAFGIVAGVVLYIGNEVTAGLGERFGVAEPERLREAMAPTNARGWALLLVVVLPVIAVFEEALFRGALIGAFAAGFGVNPWLLAVFSSVVFGFGHGAQGRFGILVTGALGFALAALFVYTGSLVLVIVAHYVVNALEFVVHERLGWEPVNVVSTVAGTD